jgi:copper chaperone
MTKRERTYAVTGMTCGHCALSVHEEVAELAGVEHVDVELGAGRLEVTGGHFSDDEVRDAVHRAGYALLSASANGDGDGGAD